MKNKKVHYIFISLALALPIISWILTYRSFYLASGFFWMPPIIFFFLTVVFLSIFVLAEKDRTILYTTLSIDILFSIILAKNFWIFMTPFCFFSLVLVIEGVKRIKEEQENRITIHIGKLIRFGLSFITTAFCLLIAVGFYFSAKNKSYDIAPIVNISIPENVLEIGLKISGNVFFREETTLILDGATVDEFLTKTMISQQGAFSEETGDIKSGARNQLEKELNFEINGDEKMSSVVGKTINKRINDFFNRGENREQRLPLGMAIALFLTTRTVAWVMSYFAVWTTMLVFHIMVKMRIFEIRKITREVEEIV